MNVWKLNLDHLYILDGDETVRVLLKQLGIPNLFSGASEFDAMHAFVAFDNHSIPTVMGRRARRCGARGALAD